MVALQLSVMKAKIQTCQNMELLSLVKEQGGKWISRKTVCKRCPSNMVSIGRYVYDLQYFEILKKLKPGANEKSISDVS